MDLEILNNLIENLKENKIVQNFINELEEALENNEERKGPLVEQILNGREITAKYRDKINVKRHEIINNYSKENEEKIYYIYSKRTDNTYGIVAHINGKTGENITLQENQLPKGTGVDYVLKEIDGKFEVNEKATQELQEQLTEMINDMLEEQEKSLEEQRIEGHIYEFVEKSGNTVWLIDETDNSKGCFEEIDFPKELVSEAKQGDMFEYIYGEYKITERK